jgi:hypothetical protein
MHACIFFNHSNLLTFDYLPQYFAGLRSRETCPSNSIRHSKETEWVEWWLLLHTLYHLVAFLYVVGDLPLLHRRQWAEQVLYGVDYIHTYIHTYMQSYMCTYIHLTWYILKTFYYIHCAVQGCSIYAVRRDAQTDEVGTRCVCMNVCIIDCVHMYVCM